jgi:hypothetical protein
VKWADGHLRYELAMDGLWVGIFGRSGSDRVMI